MTANTMTDITRESQVIYLWLSNDERLYHATRQLATDPDQLEEWIREWIDMEGQDGMIHDLLTVALSRVDWPQLAERFSD